MNNNIKKSKMRRPILFVVIGFLVQSSVCFLLVAQSVVNPIKEVRITVTRPEYEMVYLADFINVREQKLSPTISGVSVDIEVIDPPEGRGRIYLVAEVFVQLQGDAQSDLIVRGKTNLFQINGRRTLTAFDFTTRSGEIYIVNENYFENTRLRKRIEDLAQATVTVPPGTYRIVLTAYNALRQKVGSTSETIVISRSNVEEVYVEIVEPSNGAILTTLTPTFTWTTTAQDVILRIFEVGRGHRSPQDAVSAARPVLVRELSGVTTYTYPADAERKLEYEKAYVVQISALVNTNRGKVERSSKPVVFRITTDRVGKILEKFFSSQPSDAAARYTALRSEPTNWVAWQTYGSIMVDGKIITADELEELLNSLEQKGTSGVSVTIENQ
ncbi:MAG: hypothetical protein N3A63_04105 [Bacteroidetes bacterium]|nr:hypothetical protein [Bacteroidota bacterium]